METTWEPHEQRWRVCCGFREREPGRLQLRVVLGPDEGVCNVLMEEDEDAVTVLILVCGTQIPGDRCDCPVHVYLEKPLGDRAVLDLVRGRAPIAPFIARWELDDPPG
jgi:hypothetical protein